MRLPSLVALLAGAAFGAVLPAQDRVSVLFLGDRGHHAPAARAAQVQAKLAARGIDLFYTERVADLRADKLRHYDVVMIYANHVALPAACEKDLLAYVAGGGGLVPVHCASYCFLRSTAYIALVGAQFKSHGTGVFQEKIVGATHPIMRGLEPIESWDETYVHHRHNTDARTVLAVRPGDGGDEPYTWVRDHGEGRVFYTAWGHDQRTWGNAGFLELLVRGTRWACKRDPGAEPAPAGFTYREARVPEYRPGRSQGTLPRMQNPLSPAASQARLVVPPEFEVALFAAEPQIVKPIAMAFDERGRLWIAETYDYPNEMQPEGKGRDRIKICEDTDRDGKADKFTVFADKLSIPTSITFAGGGVVVSQAPHMLLLRDTDGDDVADERKVLFTGWGTYDTHAGPSNLRYGFDNHVWGSVGYSGFRGTVGGEEHRFGQGFFRFTPDGARLEYTAPTTNNTWGLGLSEGGLVFGSTANGNPSVFSGIPNRYYEGVAGTSPRALQTIAETLDFHPVSEHVRQVDFHHQFTAGAGHALYTARLFPEPYWNRAAFVCGPTGHLLGQLFLEPRGSHFVARDGWSLLASDDEWTAPIAAEVGPDGAVWVIDWYNFIVQHNPTPSGFSRGRGNAYETPLRDKRHGRIYRIRPRGAPQVEPMSLAGADADRLVAALGSDNMLWRMHAQRLLVERGKRDVVPRLLRRLAAPAVDAVGLDAPAVHALWTLHGLGALSGDDAAAPAVHAALRHPSAAVRRAALQVAPRDAALAARVLQAGLLADADPHVRVAALLALSELPRDAAAGRAVFAVLQDKANLDDRWLPDAAMIAAARHDAGFLAAALAGLRPAAVEDKKPVNLIRNASIEEGQGDAPRRWSVRHYGGRAEHTWAAGGRTGARCLRISSQQGANTSWHTRVRVQPNTRYKLSGWVRTEGVEVRRGEFGAQLNVHEIQGRDNARTKSVRGDTAWTRLEVGFDSGGHRVLTINCLLGGWGTASGTAWYDDLELVAEPELLPGPLGRVVTQVTRHYASRAPVESIVATLGALRGASPPVIAAFLEGIAAGWPEGRAPRLADGDREALAGLATGLPADLRPELLRIARRWGDVTVLGDAASVVRRDLEAAVAGGADAAARERAARQLLETFDDAAAATTILGTLTLQTDPEVAGRLVGTLEASQRDATGAAVIARWPQLSPAARDVAIATLMRRPAWTGALLRAVESAAVARTAVPPQRWLQLESHPDQAIRETAKRVGANPFAAARKEVIEKFIGVAERKGDAAKGAALFTQHCAVCHAIQKKGGAVGPPLDGIGARPRREVLIDILDPNRSVESNYQLYAAETKAGEVIGGRLDVETRTTVELLDLEGKRHVIQRKDLQSLQGTPVSLMPGAFESLGEAGLADLLEYLAQQRR